MTKLLKFLFSRMVIIGLLIIMQLGILIFTIWKLSESFVYLYVLFTAISIFSVIYILSTKDNPSYKLAWVIPVLLVPVFGGLLYLIFGSRKTTKKFRERMINIYNKTAKVLPQDEEIIREIKEDDKSFANQVKYLNNYAGSPIYKNTITKYLSPGEKFFEELKEELKKAKKYIFMEYFIIQEGVMWNSILEILEEKVKEGVDVRIIYDDMGCLQTLPYKYYEKLREKGIKCLVFNPFVPFLSVIMNNRDHRKICVIDGKVAYTGGVNLGDEYINRKVRFGHWKDTAFRLEGEGVWGLTSIFLEMWEVTMGYEITTDYSVYMPTVKMPNDGFVQPFCDGPANNPNNPAEDVYTHIINKARDYVYITTPYLVPERKMVEDLCRAARSGVDVKIIVPHIYDKWYVYMVNVANYGPLIANGVHVYEYMPGFIHSKTVVCDDECAICGTINMDYRSFYLHYECGVFTCESSAVADIRDDIHETLKQCQEIYLDEWQSRPWYEQIIQWVLRLFAPIL